MWDVELEQARGDMAIRTVGVLGCGLMGSGIAQVCAASGYRTIVRDVSDGAVQAGLATFDIAREFVGSLGQVPITIPDRPGFIVNRSGGNQTTVSTGTTGMACSTSLGDWSFAQRVSVDGRALQYR